MILICFVLSFSNVITTGLTVVKRKKCALDKQFSFEICYIFLNNNRLCSRKLIDLAYTPFHAVLKCGHLTSDVQVFPRPEPFIIDEEIDPIPKAINTGNQSLIVFRLNPFNFYLFTTTSFPV